MKFSSADIVVGATKGLKKDAALVREVLSPMVNVRVHVSRSRNLHLPHRRARNILCRKFGIDRSITFFLENIPSAWLSTSAYHVLIPNQEWIRPETERNLHSCAEVWCKTRYAQHLFSKRGHQSRYIGFTTSDLYLPEIARDPSRAIHIAGRSHMKGTRALLRVWRANPRWPVLEVITSVDEFRRFDGGNIRIISGVLSAAELARRVNECSLHLCPSEAEGYGHYIAEALSAKAVVVTTSAPPMDELVKDAGAILVQHGRFEPMGYGERFFVDEPSLARAIEVALNLTASEKVARGDAARKAFLKADADFRKRLEQAFLSFTEAI